MDHLLSKEREGKEDEGRSVGDCLVLSVSGKAEILRREH